MVGIPTFLSRASTKQASPADSPITKAGAKPPVNADSASSRPGQDTPGDMLGNSLPEKSPMSRGDKLQVAGNVAMTGACIAPMLPMGGGGEPPPPPPASGAPGSEPVGDKKSELQMQAQTATGQTPVVW